MRVTLQVVAGPCLGQELQFERQEICFVGRGDDNHFQLAADPQLSRRHFMLELHPPRCQVIDLNSKGGIVVNGVKTITATLRDGDTIVAGGSSFSVKLENITPGGVEQSILPTQVQKAPPPATLTTSLSFPVLPGYRIVRELGRGGMGIVYFAVEQPTPIGQPEIAVAIKTLNPAAAASATAVERFLREMKIVEKLTHPNIVRFRAMGENHGLIWFCMDYVDGLDAAKFVRAHGPMPIPLVCRIGCELLDGLNDAHAKSFVHRDVKPHNLLLEQGEPDTNTPGGYRLIARLTDFGLARTYQASEISGLTGDGEPGGTPMFMPPEQVHHFRDANPLSDQYSAAATLYFMLTGQTLFEYTTDIVTLMSRVVNAPPTPITAHRPDIPPRLANALMRALMKEPKARFGTLNDFRAELAEFADV